MYFNPHFYRSKILPQQHCYPLNCSCRSSDPSSFAQISEIVRKPATFGTQFSWFLFNFFWLPILTFYSFFFAFSYFLQIGKYTLNSDKITLFLKRHLPSLFLNIHLFLSHFLFSISSSFVSFPFAHLILPHLLFFLPRMKSFQETTWNTKPRRKTSRLLAEKHFIYVFEFRMPTSPYTYTYIYIYILK